MTGLAPTPVDAMFYDGLMVAAQAVREVGARPAAIRSFLQSLGTTRPPFRRASGRARRSVPVRVGRPGSSGRAGSGTRW